MDLFSVASRDNKIEVDLRYSTCNESQYQKLLFNKASIQTELIVNSQTYTNGNDN